MPRRRRTPSRAFGSRRPSRCFRGLPVAGDGGPRRSKGDAPRAHEHNAGRASRRGAGAPRTCYQRTRLQTRREAPVHRDGLRETPPGPSPTRFSASSPACSPTGGDRGSWSPWDPASSGRSRSRNPGPVFRVERLPSGPFSDRCCHRGPTSGGITPSCCIRSSSVATPQCSVILPLTTRMASTV